MELSREQQLAFDKYVLGKNIFITGPGGSGKSALIKKIYKHAQNFEKHIHVCALTGCAAVLLNCNAKTLHSWAGIGLGKGAIENLIKKIKSNKYAKALWKDTDILVVDEVSMLSLKLFTILNEIGKAVRGVSKPYGGIQLIFSGDFYQLPPVGDKDDPDSMRFCFESDDWNSIFHRDCQIQFVKIFRQTDDIYAGILNQIREGKIKRKANDLLLQYVGRQYAPGLVTEPTKLYPTKMKVENINNSKMSVLEGDEKEFKMKLVTDMDIPGKNDRIIRAQYNEKEIQMELDYLSANLICDKNIKLKLGAQVMCIVNIKSADDKGFDVCNGSQGIVVGFCPYSGFPRVKYNNGIEMIMARHMWISEKIPGICVSQIPLILAWALTIHKSQGSTMDAAEIDVGSGIFECGQTYVALSRVKSLDGLYLTSFDAKKIRINKKVKDYYESLTTFQQSNFEHQEVYVPVVIAEPIVTADSVSVVGNQFAQFEYVNE